VEARSKGPDDLAAVCRINYSAAIVVTRPDLPYRSFKGMLEWAKANPGKLVFGHSGTWGHSDLAWKLLMKETGITTKSVPHDGGGPALMAILGGHIDVNSSNIAVVLPYVRAGKLIPLAVLDDKRDSNLPDVPTAKEEGVDLVCPLWRGIMAPKGTPRPIIEKLAIAFKKMTQDKTVVTMIKQMGDGIYYLGPDEFTKAWREEYEAQRELRKIFKK
jgi:tripartite-type tricarboxylate transporter receptor subunit TctC